MNVQIEVTTRCNFDCFYCAGRDMVQQDMHLERYLAIIDGHVKQFGVPRQVSLQGEGEPTLNKSFFDMAAHVRSIGSEPFTITNGTYKYPERFAESFKHIGVSIDTMDAAEAERIGRHSLPRVLAFVDAVAPLVEVTIHSVAVSASVRQVQLWCRQRGLKHIVQPLQAKPDYQYRYPGLVTFQARPKHHRCQFLERDVMRYYAIDGVELPCVFIKDTHHFVSIQDLRDTLTAQRVPAPCLGCTYLT